MNKTFNENLCTSSIMINKINSSVDHWWTLLSNQFSPQNFKTSEREDLFIQLWGLEKLIVQCPIPLRFMREYLNGLFGHLKGWKAGIMDLGGTNLVGPNQEETYWFYL